MCKSPILLRGSETKTVLASDPIPESVMGVGMECFGRALANNKDNPARSVGRQGTCAHLHGSPYFRMQGLTYAGYSVRAAPHLTRCPSWLFRMPPGSSDMHRFLSRERSSALANALVCGTAHLQGRDLRPVSYMILWPQGAAA